MGDSQRWIVKCLYAAEGSGDARVDLPEEILAKFGFDIGDFLTIVIVDGAIVLKPIRDISLTP
jgi:antitoxin ChpS